MRALPKFWRAVHAVIIVNFLVQIIYGTYMVFFVVTGGGIGPKFGAATEMPFEPMMVRRAYATETWIAIVGLAIYLAITEILPRRLNSKDESSNP